MSYRYLWAVGSTAGQIQPGQVVGNRYYVGAPQVWLDTKPAVPPTIPESISDVILPYLHLYSHRLHLPGVHGIYNLGTTSEGEEILLLDNIPTDSKGTILPTMAEVWPKTKSIRQVYWLWQMLQLWTPLSEQGAAYSLLVKDNLRVESWRIRLIQLHQGKVKPTLKDLAEFWSAFIETAQDEVQQPLQNISQLMQSYQASLETISDELNQLLLQQAAQLPLHLAVAGHSDTGPLRSHNEDSYYPRKVDLEQIDSYPHNQLIPHLSLICDGVGGHEGGEVASQLAVKSIQPLIATFMTEINEQEGLTPPDLIIDQLQEITRVINNVISAQNNEQKRSLRQRMGTTLVMALQLPQKLKTAKNLELKNAHELYIVNVGDSRAYWITRDSCQALTIDDDVITREVKQGRSLYWEASQRQDAGALTQAVGTREAEFLRPTVQRFIIEEDGLLLLCSDGLSDNDWVEKSWAAYAPAVLQAEKSLESAVEGWINLANTHNGHDNTSVVLTYCGVSPQKLILIDTPAKPSIPNEIESEPTEASKALMYDEEESEKQPQTTTSGLKKWQQILLVIGIAVLVIGGGLALWWQVNRSTEFEPEKETVQKSSVVG
ncbi:phosphatase 2C family protein [Lyngbya aestuarii BL J]|uniref:Phosphatase 2C family protein n=1 Tax=Lyngbya aestuarii BL J TaxID=1348334 RepID=U7QCU3_9CYAN|nr:phosphatase 2C family protein [Lyngbya aestuarii BL J]